MNDTTTTTHHQHCPDCQAGLEHCHDVSVAHADGATECLDWRCTVPHVAHEWRLPCSVLEPPCPCEPDERAVPVLAAAA